MRMRWAWMGWAAWLALCACTGDKKGPIGPVEPQWFPTDVAGLDSAVAPRTYTLKEGDTLHLEAAPVKVRLKGKEVRMLAYDGSIPGPTLKVGQGQTITLILTNRTGFPTTLHSHGVRMDVQYDGAPVLSQTPIANGGSFTYQIHFPDAGVFWYHPHMREDYQQEMGLYGNYLVAPSDSAYWGPVNREQMVFVDDIQLDTNTGIPMFRMDQSDHSMMGRFGNTYLINGDTSLYMEVKRKERVRFYVTNACNTRVVYLGFTRDPKDSASHNDKMKVMGSDNGRYETSVLATNELLAPSERTVLEAYFDKPGTVYLVNNMIHNRLLLRDVTEVIGRIKVLDDSVDTPYGDNFAAPDTSFQTIRSIDSVRTLCDPSLPPDKELFLTEYIQSTALASAAAEQPDPGDLTAKDIEWYDHMRGPNSVSTTEIVHLFIRDLKTGKENMAIDWEFNRGDKIRVRVTNDKNFTGTPGRLPHPMPHPLHFHGQRFLVAAVNGIRNPSMAWKDTHLIGVGETVDLLVDMGNPGEWMAHCHIAEHADGGMMFHFKVH